jgi:hypothetical protein
MTFDCFQRWNSCNKSNGDCQDGDGTREGKFFFNGPDAHGVFSGTYTPKGAATPEPVIGKCSEASPNLTVLRIARDGRVHLYFADADGDSEVRGKHQIVFGLDKGGTLQIEGDDDWTGSHTT